MRSAWLPGVVLLSLGAAPGRAAAPPREHVRAFVYKKTKEADLKMHVHFPPGWKKDDKRPVVVFFFGGGWARGDVKQFAAQAAYFAGRGLVTARADYRVKTRHDVAPDACVQDAKSAVRYLRRNAATLGIDPARVVAAGGSAGGHIAACTACPGLDAAGEDLKVSSRPDALLLFNPVLRFDGVPELLKRVGDDRKLAKAISPVLHVTKESPPALLLYGKEDRLLEQGEEFLKACKKAGARAEMFLADGVGHGFFNREPWRAKTTLRADEFLTSLGYLKGKPTLKVP